MRNLKYKKKGRILMMLMNSNNKMRKEDYNHLMRSVQNSNFNNGKDCMRNYNILVGEHCNREHLNLNNLQMYLKYNI